MRTLLVISLVVSTNLIGSVTSSWHTVRPALVQELKKEMSGVSLSQIECTADKIIELYTLAGCSPTDLSNDKDCKKLDGYTVGYIAGSACAK